MRFPLVGLLVALVICTPLAREVHAQAWGGVSYQGLLLDPAGGPLNGTVNLILRIWDDPISVALAYRLYEESHFGVAVVDGVFSVTLGQGSAASGAFGADLFSDPNRFLEVVVNGEALAPRQPVLAVAYAFQAQICVEALKLAPAEVDAIVAAAQGGLTFSNIGGQLGDGQIPVSIARDAEVLGLVTGADGSGSGLDADLLDGFDQSAFSRLGPSIESAEITDATVQTADLANAAVNSAKIANGTVAAIDLADGSGSGVDADLLDGFDFTAFLRSGADFNYDGGVLVAGPSSSVQFNGGVSIGIDSATDDDVILFDNALLPEELRWSEQTNEFRFSDDVAAQSFRLTGTVYRQVRIPAAGFMGVPDPVGSWTLPYPERAYGYNSDGSGTTSMAFTAPVDLPIGATITDLQCEHFEQPPGFYGLATLYVRSDGETAVTVLAEVLLGEGASGSVVITTDSTIAAPATVTVDAYYWIAGLMTGLGGTQNRFYGCTVWYQPSAVGPE